MMLNCSGASQDAGGCHGKKTAASTYLFKLDYVESCSLSRESTA